MNLVPYFEPDCMSLHSLHWELILHYPLHCGSCKSIFAKQKLGCLLNSTIEPLPQVHEVLKSKGEAQELLRMCVR